MRTIFERLPEGSVFEDSVGDRWAVKGVVQGQLVVEKMNPVTPNRDESKIIGTNDKLEWLYPEDPLLESIRNMTLDAYQPTVCPTCVTAGVVLEEPATWPNACDACKSDFQTINQLKNIILGV